MTTRPTLSEANHSRRLVVSGADVGPPSTLLVRRGQGKHWVQLPHVSQLIHDPGQLSGPWFIRCDGQQLPISEGDALAVAKALGVDVT
jgi:hypothetical protein